MRIGNRLSSARAKAGFKQEEVAETLGITRQTLSNWENDRTLPDILQAQELAMTYGVNLEELIFEKKEPEISIVQPVSSRLFDKKERGILIGYLSVWVILSLCSWCWNYAYGPSGSFGYGIIFYIFCLPLLTGVSSLLTGLLNCWKRHRLLIIFFFGLGHVVFHFVNFWIAFSLSTSSFHFPEMNEVVFDVSIGLVISSAMYTVGRLISWLIEKLDQMKERTDPIVE